MAGLAKLTSGTKRAAITGLLLAVPLLPLAACSNGDDGGDGGGAEVENGEGGEEDDSGAY